MRVATSVTTAGFVLLATWAASGDTARGCVLPPRVVKAHYDAGGARYEWLTACDGDPVVIRGSYNDRTNRATQVVVFPSPEGAMNSFDVRCARNPWAPGARLPCTGLRAVVSTRSAFTEPWLGHGVLRRPGSAPRGRRNMAERGSPTPLLPPSGAALPLRGGRAPVPVELRWTSSAGPEARYRVEVHRAIAAQGPFSHVHETDVSGTRDLSTGYSIPPRILTTPTHRYWRWRVGQATDGGAFRYSAWQTFSFK